MSCDDLGVRYDGPGLTASVALMENFDGSVFCVRLTARRSDLKTFSPLINLSNLTRYHCHHQDITQVKLSFLKSNEEVYVHWTT